MTMNLTNSEIIKWELFPNKLPTHSQVTGMIHKPYMYDEISPATDGTRIFMMKINWASVLRLDNNNIILNYESASEYYTDYTDGMNILGLLKSEIIASYGRHCNLFNEKKKPMFYDMKAILLILRSVFPKTRQQRLFAADVSPEGDSAQHGFTN
jgi:hypothetical protein